MQVQFHLIAIAGNFELNPGPSDFTGNVNRRAVINSTKSLNYLLVEGDKIIIITNNIRGFGKLIISKWKQLIYFYYLLIICIQ